MKNFLVAALLAALAPSAWAQPDGPPSPSPSPSPSSSSSSSPPPSPSPSPSSSSSSPPPSSSLETRLREAEARASEAERRYQVELEAHRKTQEGVAYKDLDEDVRALAEKKAAARAEKLSFLIQPPGGVKWASLGAYLGALAGTGDLGAPMSLMFGGDLKIYPSPWGLVARVRAGGNYDLRSGDYWGTTPMSAWGARYEALVGWELTPVSLAVGYSGTTRHWSRIDGEGMASKIADESSMSHGFAVYLSAAVRGSEFSFGCTVGTVGLPDQQGHVAESFSGRASQCGLVLTAPLLGF